MITNQKKLKLIEYELAYFKKSLPRAVEEGKVGEAFAKEKIETFEAIKNDYVERVRADAVSA
jgi:hypothetical protein